VVFCGGQGVSFVDNSRFLYEKFVHNYSEELEVVWVSRSQDLVDRMNREGRRSVQQFSIEGVRTILKARTVFFSWGPIDLPGMGLSKRTRSVQLWHGIPIKTGGFQEKWVRKSTAHEVFKNLYNFLMRHRTSYWVTSSVLEDKLIALCFGIPNDGLILSGYPRNDYLIEQLRSPTSELHLKFPYLNKKVILYAPTWRPGEKIVFFPFPDNDFKALHSFLERNDAYMLIRGHLKEEPDERYRDGLIRVQERFDFNALDDRILLANRDLFEDFQELLPYVDVLISDYSGGWVDFLLTGRPLIFIPYDLESFLEGPGLMHDYEVITPGPKVDSLRGLMEAIHGYLEDPAKDLERRRFIRSLFHKFEDGLSYERIHDTLFVNDESRGKERGI